MRSNRAGVCETGATGGKGDGEICSPVVQLGKLTIMNKSTMVKAAQWTFTSHKLN